MAERRDLRDRVRRGATRALAIVAVLNFLFVGFALAARAVPPAGLVERIRAAFASGQLLEHDYLPFDSRRGYDQYSECIIFQMVINRTDAYWVDAVAPLMYREPADNWLHQCAPLKRIVTEGVDPSLFEPHRLTRYWYGFVPLCTALLSVFALETAQGGLKLAIYTSLVFLGIAGLRDRALRPLALPLAVVGALFWGIPYNGQTFCRAPADTVAILGLCGLVVARTRLSRLEALVPYCAAYGSALAYFEGLTGPLPTAAALLLPMAYAMGVSRSGGAAGRDGWRLALGGVAAFALGAGLTIAFKQILVMIALGPDPVLGFLHKLQTRTAPVESSGEAPSLLLPFEALYTNRSVLTYGSFTWADLLLASSAVAWICAALLGLRRGHRSTDFFAFVAGAAIVAAWIAAFQQHTFMHAPFMVRLLMPVIALGWASLSWQVARSATAASAG